MNVKLKHFHTEAAYSDPIASQLATPFYREQVKWIMSYAVEELLLLEFYGYMFSTALACSCIALEQTECTRSI